MAGTIEGGLKARDKNLQKDPDWYKRIGAKGGKVSGKPKGFAHAAAHGLTWHIKAGQRGGQVSRRNKQEV